MMKHEFDEQIGLVCDDNMYANEIEPTYMMFEGISKKGLAKAYWGEGNRKAEKDGGYGLFTRLNEIRKEIQKNNHPMTSYLFRKGCERIAELFRESDGIIERINHL